jgi:LysR family hydrogen peroxide-inducible transcriptional activator
MELRQLEYLVAIDETGSFSAAARRLGVRQPSISEQIKRLETMLRQPLLDRLPGRVVPTAAGRQLLDHARRILAEVAEARGRAADAAGGEVSGRLAIGVIPTIAPFLLPRLVPRFERQHPKVELIASEQPTPRLIELLAQGEIDVAVASVVDPAPTHVQVEAVADEPLVLMMPAKHRLARRRRVTLAEAGRERFVALHEVHCLAGQSARFCLMRDPRPPVVMHGDSLFTLATMVAAGTGVSIVPRMMADGGAAVRGCAFRPFAPARDVPAPTRSLTLLWPLLRYRTLAARAFAAMATATLRARR